MTAHLTMARPVPQIASDLGNAVERMIAIQMEAAPSDWDEADKREFAMRTLFGIGAS